jgi:hypothetical protein
VKTFLTNSSAAAPSRVPGQSVTIYHRLSTLQRTNERSERQLRLVEFDLRETETSRGVMWMEWRRRVEEEEEEEGKEEEEKKGEEEKSPALRVRYERCPRST